MSRRIFLHVGSPKTGTTFLQRVLWSHKELLREQGVLLPLESFTGHYLACQDLRGLHARSPRSVGTWARLVAEVDAWEGDALVSHELFAAATAEEAETGITTLSSAEVHVVVTARDLARQIPAEWQEHLKHRSTMTYLEFVNEVRNHGSRAKWFWQVQDVAAVLDRWGRSLPRMQVHLVTVPSASSGPAELWKRFSGLIGVQADHFSLSVGRSNSSLGVEQAELLRLLNMELGPRLPMPGPYPQVVKEMLAHKVLARRQGSPLGLARENWDYAVYRSRQMVVDLEKLEVDVVGDLSELVPPDEGSHSPAELQPPAAQTLLDESVAVLADVLDRYHRDAVDDGPELRARLTAAEQHAADVEQHAAHVEQERDRLLHDMQHRPVRHLLIGLSMRWQWAAALRRAYWRLMDAVPDRLRRSRARQ